MAGSPGGGGMLADIFSPLLERMINEPPNKNSRYEHYNRIMIRFFPKTKTQLNDLESLRNQFYTVRKLHYHEQKSGQTSFAFL